MRVFSQPERRYDAQIANSAGFATRNKSGHRSDQEPFQLRACRTDTDEPARWRQRILRLRMLAMVTVLKSRYVVALAAFGAALLFHPEDEVLES
jgi:hypothetical protein